MDELRQLRDGGLTLLYYGIETGSADLLKRITKKLWLSFVLVVFGGKRVRLQSVRPNC